MEEGSQDARPVFPVRVLRGGVVGLLHGYKFLISPWIPPCCRFTPTCSEYGMEAVARYGILVGIGKTLWRVARCNPFCKGGYDPP